MKKDQVVKYLLQNESFRDWVKHRSDDATQKTPPESPSQPFEEDSGWMHWPEENPEFAEEFEVAKDIILGISFQKEEVASEQIESARKMFWSSVDNQTGKSRPAKVVPMYKKWLSHVAAIALVVISTWVVFDYIFDSGNDRGLVSNEVVGAIREIKLPDNTVVTLNANSNIVYNQEEWDNIREVFLEGEAFFKVKKVNVEDRPQKFEVKTKDLTISVLGTSFNVDEGPLGTTVVLEEGSIELKIKGHSSSILMEPGDKVVYSRDQGLVAEDLVRPRDYSSWKEGVLVLEGKNLGEVAQWLERRYKVEIGIESQISEVPLSGSVNTSQLDNAIRAISLAAGVSAEKLNERKWKME